VIPIDAPREWREYQKILTESVKIGNQLDRIWVEHALQFVSDEYGIFEYRDMKNRRFYFTENDEFTLIYVGKNILTNKLT